MEEYTGQQTGNYQLIQRLGGGEAAEVYLGMHIDLNTLAAIKIIQHPLREPDASACLDEASALVGLIHPNIVRLLDYGLQDEKLFLVMEYVPGDTLWQVYAPGAHLGPVFIIALIKQIADIVQYAHDQNIIHGNLKPENILLGPNNELLISDFGIAMLLQIMGAPPAQSRAGTSAYRAPEQWEGKLQRASDQYALALVAYEWLNSEQLLQDTVIANSSQHLQDQIAPLQTQGPTLDDVLNKALEKDPAQRFSSIQEFTRILEQAYYNTAEETLPISSMEALPTMPVEYPIKPDPILFTELETQPVWQAPEVSSSSMLPPFVPESVPAPTHEEYPFPTFSTQQTRSRSNPAVILLILCLIGIGAVGTVFFVGPNRLLQIVHGNQTTSQLASKSSSAQAPVQLPSVEPTSQAPTPTQELPTPTPTPLPTPTPQPTATPEQQAQSAIAHYFAAINNKDYQTAYNLWVNYPDSYQNFANGFADSKHDDYQLSTITPQSDGTVQVALTLVATSTTSQQTTYQGYYIVGQQPDNTWKIVTASMQQQ